MNPLVWLLAGVAVLVVSWALQVLAAARLPDGTLKELAGIIPASVTTVRRLRNDPTMLRHAGTRRSPGPGPGDRPSPSRRLPVRDAADGHAFMRRR
jgi:hypothetical protein